MTKKIDFKSKSLLVLWILLICFGLGVGLEYENQSGAIGEVPSRWPANSQITPSAGFTLLMFVHPECPCTSASLEEFNRLLAHCYEQVQAHVVFVNPQNVSRDWARNGDHWEYVQRLPQIKTFIDDGGLEAKHFGAITSGSTFLYDHKGQLKFSGGITLARGHVGDNAGKAHIESSVFSKESNFFAAPVFGCPLLDSSLSSIQDSFSSLKE